MKINREIIVNGVSQNVEYELTGVELERCFNEYRHTRIADEVRRQLRDGEDEYDVDAIPEHIIGEIASDIEYDLDNDTFDTIVLQNISAYKGKLEQYKCKWKVFSKRVTMTATHEYTIKAKSEADAETIFERWSESNAKQILEDLTEDADQEAEFEYDCVDEEPDCDPDYADLAEEW